MSTLERTDLEKAKFLLKEKLARLMPKPGDVPVPFGGVCLHRWHTPTRPNPVVYQPVLIVLAQGRKSIKFGEQVFSVQEGGYFVAGVDIPMASSMHDTSPENPYLSLTINLDGSLITQMAAEIPRTEGSYDSYFRSAMLAEMDADLMDAILRLVELIERPEQAKMLGPMVIKEIHYRLLTGPFGGQLLSINTYGTPGNQIARATAWLRENYNKSLIVEELAKRFNMAPSTFHKHFREITTLSPLQYQKRLRLAEAQRLMLTLGHDAAQACTAVGYESLPQFNREYKRLYGEPPRKNITRMKEIFGFV
jgi:AraC-like DNA-binding protein